MPFMPYKTTGHLQMLLPNQRGETCLLLTQNKLQQSPTSPAANLQRGRFSLHGILNFFFFFHLLSENELSGSTFGEMGFLPYEMWIQDKNGLHSRNSGRAKVKTLPQVQNGNVCRGVSGVKHTGIPTATFGVKETLVIHPLLVFKDFLHFLKECPSHCLLSWVFVHGV